MALRRLTQLVSVVLVVVFFTALLLRVVPGDPARAILGQRADAASLQAMRQELGVDESLPDQLWRIAGRLLHGDLGSSAVASGTPVTSIITSHLGVTLKLAGLAVLFAALIGVSLGVVSGMTTRRSAKSAANGAILVGLAVPTFATGLILLLIVGVKLQWAPSGGWDASGGGFHYLWLPALALSGYLSVMIARSTSRAVATVREAQFYEAAVSRGLSRPRLILRHVLPNSALPVIVILGVNAAYLVSGAVTIEAIFGLPGVGSELLMAAQRRDFPVVQGIAVASAVLVVLINWLTELAVALVDPRVRDSH